MAEQPPLEENRTSLSLLERARSRDAEAWHRLVQLYRPLVLFWCRRGGVLPADVEDVAQEVFAASAQALERFRHDRPGDTFRGWLHGITRYQTLTYLRRRGGDPAADGGSAAWLQLQEVPAPEAVDPDETQELSTLHRRLVELVRREFEERTWQAFWRTVIDDRDTATVAAELGMTTANVRQARSRVLRRLKQEVGELLP